jgi:hypothetical protein
VGSPFVVPPRAYCGTVTVAVGNVTGSEQVPRQLDTIGTFTDAEPFSARAFG